MKSEIYATRPLAPGDHDTPWLTHAVQEWKFQPLKHLVSINALALGEDTDPDLEINYIDIGNVNAGGHIVGVESMRFEDAPSRARRILKRGDVFVSTVRTYLKAIAICNSDESNLVCSTGFAVLTPSEKVDSKFLFYWVRSSWFVDEIVSRSVGVSYPAINANEIGSLPFPMLDKDSQTEIAQFLEEKISRLDEIIHCKTEQIGLLDEQRRALITQAVTQGIGPPPPPSSHLNNKNGEIWSLGVPAGWTTKKMTWLFGTIGSGTTPNTETFDFYEGDIPWVNTGELKDCDVEETEKFVSHTTLKSHTLPLYKAETVLMAMYGATIGKLGILKMDATTNQACVAFAEPQKILPKFLFYWLFSNRETIIAMARGGGQPNISQELVRQLRVTLPKEIEEQRAIADYLDGATARLDEIRRVLSKQLERLGEYRAALITQAVTGQIRV